MINLELIECEDKQKKIMPALPFLTRRGWVVLLAVGALGGIIGGLLYGAVIASFANI